QRYRFGCLLRTRLGYQSQLALFAVQRLEYFIGALGLIPVHVVGMFGLLLKGRAGLMAIENRAAECRSLHRVAVAARGAVAAGEHEFERAGTGLAEQGVSVIGKAVFLGDLLLVG